MESKDAGGREHLASRVSGWRIIPSRLQRHHPLSDDRGARGRGAAHDVRGRGAGPVGNLGRRDGIGGMGARAAGTGVERAHGPLLGSSLRLSTKTKGHCKCSQKSEYDAGCCHMIRDPANSSPSHDVGVGLQ